jgi:general secretion pathway protein J
MKTRANTHLAVTAAGFTLVELVIALAIVTVITTLSFAGLKLGARAWDAVEQRTVEVHDRQLAARFIVRQLEQARAVTFVDDHGEERLAFRGDSKALQFVAPLPSLAGGGGLHWQRLDLAQAAEATHLMLTYELFQTEGWERYGANARHSVMLYKAVADAEFSYFGAPDPDTQARWWAQWRDTETLPELVRIRVQGQNASRSWEELVAVPRLTSLSDR